MTAPCYGQAALFDSTLLADHIEAARLCSTCPVVDVCHDRLEEAKALAKNKPGHGPDGTWAGLLIMGGKVIDTLKQERAAFEESIFSDEDAKLCHRLFRQGKRGEWIEAGERTYQRRACRRQRRDRAARKAAAA